MDAATLEQIKDIIILIFNTIGRSITSFTIGLALVYLFGRMLMIVKSDRTKNFIGFLGILGTTIAQEICIYKTTDIVSIVLSVSMYTAIAIILYVLIGFKLYSRMDTLLDKKIAKDKERRIKK